jgi:phosphoglycolate phosphatase
MRSVIFDLDGTLADTSGDLIAAANMCFAQMGAPDLLDPQKDAGTALKGGRAMLSLGFSRLGRLGDEVTLNAYYPILLEAYRQAIDVYTVLYPRAMDAVEQLKVQGYKVGICTNKPEALAALLLRRLGILDAFGSLVGAGTLVVRKPDPEPLFEAVRRAGGVPDMCCLVGDTVTDRATAKAANVPSILVTFGPAGGDMAALEPEGLLNDFDALPDLVAKLIGSNRAE